MEDKKVVFFDIDGTLLHEGSYIPPSTIAAIQQLRHNGVETFIATGRGPAMLSDIPERLGIDSFVCYNGQIVVHQGEVVYRNTLPTDALRRLTEHAGSNDHTLVYLGQHHGGATKANDHVVEQSLGELDMPIPTYDPNFHIEQAVYQTLLYCTPEEEHHYLDAYGEFDFIRWHPHAMDVINRGASKADGIRHFIETNGYRLENTYAFGDALNDLAMLQYVGTGIAMGNARVEAKEVADFVTKSILEDGIEYGLKSMKLI
ncbi:MULTISPECIES: Cof-type HAD-IIB family hydrolase [unclassified Exiguobacterium]|uniref:Cof-type HAD-IIB family hydrolase n=1 Tax=unclassified Exiguobacterium TaxID=2644629 RepID=UPI00103E24E7|nr:MULTISPECIES: Cof-type HAD-IIB family hydrolase [unclassified Exiguobacterium]TCI73772.1 Cof-type HAD-IIB family hydrolase [Exiguobacterium sp. IPCI3]TCI82930.1 Cof-type HAD-IIB family hydrolase [Exiguobacterium sp. IPCH1]TCI83985.1 Cof-type HAD-IIB family hydrolase [Exiguobacterium sp. IPBC4]